MGDYQTGELIPLKDFLNKAKPEGISLVEFKKKLAEGFGCCWHTLHYHLKKDQGFVFVNEEIKILIIKARTYDETLIEFHNEPQTEE